MNVKMIIGTVAILKETGERVTVESVLMNGNFRVVWFSGSKLNRRIVSMNDLTIG